jgi:hypothetical protein
VRTDYAGYIVGFDHCREGGSYLVRYEDGDLRHFPARELDTYRNYYVRMQNCAPPPERAQEHGNVLFTGFTPVPNTYAATVKQAGGFIFLDQLSRENNLFQLRDNRLPTSVPARNTHCLIVNTTKMVLSLCPLFPQGSNERETLRQFVHFLPQHNLHINAPRNIKSKQFCHPIHITGVYISSNGTGTEDFYHTLEQQNKFPPLHTHLFTGDFNAHVAEEQDEALLALPTGILPPRTGDVASDDTSRLRHPPAPANISTVTDHASSAQRGRLLLRMLNNIGYIILNGRFEPNSHPNSPPLSTPYTLHRQ